MQNATNPHAMRVLVKDAIIKETGTAMGLFGPWPYVLLLFILTRRIQFFLGRVEEVFCGYTRR